MSERSDKKKPRTTPEEIRRKAEKHRSRLKEIGVELPESLRAEGEAQVKRMLAEADRMESLIADLNRQNELYAKMAARIEPILEGNDSLPPFDFDALSEDHKSLFMGRKDRFLRHGNAHALIELFSICVRGGKMTPPAWVLEPLAQGFTEYTRDGEGDLKVLAKSLGLMGKATGKTPPQKAWKREYQLKTPVDEMQMLIASFGLKKAPAAEAVILKHKLSESVSTLKRYYDEQWSDLTGVEINEVQHDEYKRTKFLSSFPPAALKIIRKKIKRNNT